MMYRLILVTALSALSCQLASATVTNVGYRIGMYAADSNPSDPTYSDVRYEGAGLPLDHTVAAYMGETTANGHFQFTSDAAARNVEFKANINMHVNRHWGDALTMGSEEQGIGFTITEPMQFSLAQQCLFQGLGRDHMSYRLRSVDFSVNHQWTIGAPVPGGYFEAPPRSGVIPAGEYVFRFGFAMTNNPNANPSSTPVVSADGFVSLNLSPVPEPSGIAAAAVGCVSWVMIRRRRRYSCHLPKLLASLLRQPGDLPKR